MKNLIKMPAMIIGLVFSGIILFSVNKVSHDKKFKATFFHEIQREGYESSPAVVKLDVSPALAWDHTGGAWKFLGYIMLIVMGAGLWYVGTDRYLGKRNINRKGGENKGLAYVVILGPVLLSAIFFFGGYSSTEVSNSTTIDRTVFDGWLNTGAIEKKSDNNYLDKSGVITALFDKPFIR